MSKLTDEHIAEIFSVRRGAVIESHLLGCARAIEAAATEPLLQRIAELERENAKLKTVPMMYRRMAFNAELQEKVAELERQLEEARKQMEAQKDEWLSWEANRKALEKDAESYQQLRNGSNWPAVFASHDAPEPLRGEELDAAMQKGQS